ncbi:MAG: nitrate reductase subunit beta, partial [Anaerolineae bacterium]|nr:nitrate reductase subunit beta [Anaerolineae bacterium]
PADPQVIEAARKNGIPDGVLAIAQKSPVYKYVKEWRLALPLHPEFRTLPMLFYVPPLLPVVSATQPGGTQRLADDFFGTLEHARLPMQYMAGLFSAGQVEPVEAVYRRLLAVRLVKRLQAVGDADPTQVSAVMAEAQLSEGQVEEIYHLTTQSTYYDHFVIPPMAREMADESITSTDIKKKETGFGFKRHPHRGP